MKYADYLVLLAKEEVVLQGMTKRLIETGRQLWNGNECGKNYGDESLKVITANTDNYRSKTVGEQGLFQLFGQHDNK